jgi:hypothetical protein
MDKPVVDFRPHLPPANLQYENNILTSLWEKVGMTPLDATVEEDHLGQKVTDLYICAEDLLLAAGARIAAGEALKNSTSVITIVLKYLDAILASVNPKGSVVLSFDGGRPFWGLQMLARELFTQGHTSQPWLLVPGMEGYLQFQGALATHLRTTNVTKAKRIVLPSAVPGDALYKLRAHIRKNPPKGASYLYGRTNAHFLTACALQIQDIKVTLLYIPTESQPLVLLPDRLVNVDRDFLHCLCVFDYTMLPLPRHACRLDKDGALTAIDLLNSLKHKGWFDAVDTFLRREDMPTFSATQPPLWQQLDKWRTPGHELNNNRVVEQLEDEAVVQYTYIIRAAAGYYLEGSCDNVHFCPTPVAPEYANTFHRGLSNAANENPEDGVSPYLLALDPTSAMTLIRPAYGAFTACVTKGVNKVANKISASNQPTGYKAPQIKEAPLGNGTPPLPQFDFLPMPKPKEVPTDGPEPFPYDPERAPTVGQESEADKKARQKRNKANKAKSDTADKNIATYKRIRLSELERSELENRNPSTPMTYEAPMHIAAPIIHILDNPMGGLNSLAVIPPKISINVI